MTDNNSGLQILWRTWGYPLVLLAALLGAAAWIQVGATLQSVALGAWVAVFTLLILLLERLDPARSDWQPRPATLGLDLLHSLASSLVFAPLARGAVVGLSILLARATGDVSLGLWPSDWPLAAQLLVAVPLADLGVYWAHRFMHTTDWGWRLHAVHHSPTRLYSMASARSHPGNVVIAMGAQWGMLRLIGASPEVMALWSVFHAVNGLLQHANIGFEPRALSGILATSLVHREHHALDDSRCNFGNMTMLWDRLFGTYKAPPARPADVGAGGYAIPEHYGVHLLLPWRLPRYATSTTEPMPSPHSAGGIAQGAGG